MCKKIIIRYKGGLGNQMFQYALRCNFENIGIEVSDDLTFYKDNPSQMPFVIDKVFPNIVLQNSGDEIWEIIEKDLNRNAFEKLVNKFLPYTKKHYYEKNEYKYDKQVLKVRNGCVEGYWQSSKYVENIKNIIERQFEFPEIQNKEIENLVKEICSVNSVSIHIRAGDYLKKENSELFGGICDLEYYKKAVDFIQNKVKTPVFFVFSDDIKWCKKNILLNNVIWVENQNLLGYEDWWDMYLMSCCKYNIIANSTFSWWGAFLNANRDKIVIAPKKWINNKSNDEICCNAWIRL